jgi:hypothetical protein
MRVALIGCGKSKADHECQARDLYTGSLFRASLAYCEPRFEWIRIVSAFHGLVRLDDLVFPYERTLKGLGKAFVAGWAFRIVDRLKMQAFFAGLKIESVSIFAGADYAEPLRAELRQRRIHTELPLEGLTQGRRLQWFKEAA